jgi:hypothetical protein
VGFLGEKKGMIMIEKQEFKRIDVISGIKNV